MGQGSALSSFSFEAFDPEALARVANLPLEQRLTKPGDFRGRITKLSGDEAYLLIVDCNHPFVCSGRSLPGGWNLSTLMRGADGVRVNGAAISPGQCHTLPPESEIHFCTSPNITFTGLFVRDEIVRQRAAALGCIDPAAAVRGPTMFNPAGEPGRRYWRKLFRIRDRGTTNGYVSPAQAHTLLHDLTNEYLASTIGRTEPRLLTSPRATINRYSIVRRAEDYLREHATHPVYMDELCSATHTSERALEYAFSDVIGVSPYNYLMALRLNRARAELLNTPLRAQIKSTALAWGFTHLGRFSEHYKRLFGELPSETIRSERFAHLG